MSEIKHSELILNPSGSIYHLDVAPNQIAHNIIFVGDQNRVEAITRYFDQIEFSVQKREFKTTTGSLNGKRLTVISTGIGPDNIDIVLNELDALVNIDFETRTLKPQLTSLNIVRVGTSGSLQKDVPVDSLVMSVSAIGTDNMLRSYAIDHITDSVMENAFMHYTHWDIMKGRPYAVTASEKLVNKFSSSEITKGITITAGGFYGAQGRILRLPLQDNQLNAKIDSFMFNGYRATNLEMETAAIYGLAALLGHNALSLNAIVANRADGTFSKDPYKTIEHLIDHTLQQFAE